MTIRSHRPWPIVLLTAFLLTAPTFAQTVDRRPLKMHGFVDDTAEFVWRVQNPGGPSDYFSVDFDQTLMGVNLVGLGVTAGTSCSPIGPRHLLLTQDNLALDPTGHTPDLNQVISGTSLNPTGLPVGLCADVAFDVPDVQVGSSGTHVVFGWQPFDTCVWLCSDSDGPGGGGGSYFSADAFTTPATPFTATNWMLTAGTIPDPDTFWVNGGISARIVSGDEVSFLFRGCATAQPYLIFLSDCNGNLVDVALPSILTTGTNAVDDVGHTGTLTANWPLGVTGVFCFQAVYLDVCSVPPKLKVSGEVQVTVQ